MSSDLKQEWNKAKDTATYYVNRAESKIEQTKNVIVDKYDKSEIKEKIEQIKYETQKTVKPFWNTHQDSILVGSALAAGSLIVLLSTRF